MTERYPTSRSALTAERARIMINAAQSDPRMKDALEVATGKAWDILSTQAKIDAILAFNQVSEVSGHLVTALKTQRHIGEEVRLAREEMTLRDQVVLLEDERDELRAKLNAPASGKASGQKSSLSRDFLTWFPMKKNPSPRLLNAPIASVESNLNWAFDSPALRNPMLVSSLRWKVAKRSKLTCSSLLLGAVPQRQAWDLKKLASQSTEGLSSPTSALRPIFLVFLPSVTLFLASSLPTEVSSMESLWPKRLRASTRLLLTTLIFLRSHIVNLKSHPLVSVN